MSRINQNISSLIAQRLAANNSKLLSSSLERLSTGLRINRGSDDPSGLITSENLRGDMRGISAALSNAERAEQVVNVAESGLQEISDLLGEVRGLVGSSANKAGVTADERAANQLQIDSILSTIDRMANSVSFQGAKLLNGSYDYNLSGSTSSNSGFADITVNGAKLSDAGTARKVDVQVLTSAQRAVVYLSAGATFNNNNSGSVTFEITGDRGSQQFTIASGTTIANVAAAINAYGESLGVSAAVSGSLVKVQSINYGTDSFVRMREVSGGTATRNWIKSSAAATTVDDYKDLGRDARVSINGTVATAAGLTARVASDSLDITLTLNPTSTLNSTNATRSFYVTGGGADFMLSPDVNLGGKASVGFDTVTTGNLGNALKGFLSDLRSGGSANVQNGNLTKAQDIIDVATNQVSSLRGRLGAFTKNVIGSTVDSLNVAYENVSAAESAIRDTDFAAETARLTRSQILQQASMQALLMANDRPRSLLKLLG